MMKTILVSLCALSLLAWPALVGADSYKYVDKDGTVHYTDNPYELPEPQRTRVLRQLEQDKKERDANNASQNQGLPPGSRDERLPPGPISGGGGAATGIMAKPKDQDATQASDGAPAKESARANREKWQSEYKNAKADVAKYEAECTQLESERDHNKRKSLMFATPGARQSASQAARDLENCQAKLKKARHYLTEGLPAKARRAGIPTHWLRD